MARNEAFLEDEVPHHKVVSMVIAAAFGLGNLDVPRGARYLGMVLVIHAEVAEPFPAPRELVPFTAGLEPAAAEVALSDFFDAHVDVVAGICAVYPNRIVGVGCVVGISEAEAERGVCNGLGDAGRTKCGCEEVGGGQLHREILMGWL